MRSLAVVTMVLASLASTANVRASGVTSAASTCAVPFENAAIVNAAAPNYPKRSADAAPLHVLIEVAIDAAGAPTNATIYKSSGDAVVDAAAQKAALHSSYTPTRLNCVAIPGTIVFRSDVDPGGSAPPALATCNVYYRGVTLAREVLPTYTGADVGTARIRVTVAPDGSVRSVFLARSSGSRAIDKAAITAALASTYHPQIVDCAPTVGTYTFKTSLNYATPAPDCANPDQSATFTNRVQPVYVAQRAGAARYETTIVDVTVEPSGSVAHARVLISSGDALADQAALHAANVSSYSPRLVVCDPIVGHAIARYDVAGGSTVVSPERTGDISSDVPEGKSVLLEVSLSASGGVTAAKILRGSGDRAVDAKTLRDAWSLRYSPKRVDGVAVPSIDVVLAEYDS